MPVSTTAIWQVLTLSQTIPDFYFYAVLVFKYNMGKVEIARHKKFLLFLVFSTHFKNILNLPFSSIFKLPSFNLEESKILS